MNKANKIKGNRGFLLQSEAKREILQDKLEKRKNVKQIWPAIPSIRTSQRVREAKNYFLAEDVARKEKQLSSDRENTTQNIKMYGYDDNKKMMV